jgi:hypothetical protein
VTPDAVASDVAMSFAILRAAVGIAMTGLLIPLSPGFVIQ